MTDPIEIKNSFEVIGQEPHMWLAAAIRWKVIADHVGERLKATLSPYPERRAPYDDLVWFNNYMYLAGMALENLTKGIPIGRNPSVVSPDRFDLHSLVRSEGGHDLRELAQKVAADLTADEVDLMKRLTEFIVWAGKYPIHRKASRTTHPSFKVGDPDRIDAVFLRFAAILRSEHPESTVGFG